MSNVPQIILPADPGGDEWLLLRNPVCVLTASAAEEVMPCVRAVERQVDSGLVAAGFLSYEAARGFDEAFCVHELSPLPLAWFALFDRTERFEFPGVTPGGAGDEWTWTPSISRDTYAASVGKIRQYLKDGDAYQVNLTMRLRSPFHGDPLDSFFRMHFAQRSAYAAYIETEDFAVCSASPELFFRLDGERLVSRPMKGTSRRGMTTLEDRALSSALAGSAKEQAENVMIVDMVRNDMGRVAEPGTVVVERLFDVERYPTVLQMTSTVACRTSASMCDLFGALFPCASITGAPKVRTMEIIREIEDTPRGIYTGSIGYIAPGRKAWFNVAIRTVTVNKHSGSAEYGVGGGIVWDSDVGNEYRECLVKAGVLTGEYREFELIETLLWEGAQGFFLEERHLARLADSAAYFDFHVDMADVRERLMASGAELGNRIGKVRLLVSRSGQIRIEVSEYRPVDPAVPWKLVFAGEPVDTTDPFLYHKTTNHPVWGRRSGAVAAGSSTSPSRPQTSSRSAGGAELRSSGGTGGAPEDVLSWNERGEVTESSIANVVIERGGRRRTPPIRCGVLAGGFRGWLLDNGEIEEAPVTIADVRAADRIFLINSVRKWVPAVLMDNLMGGPNE